MYLFYILLLIGFVSSLIIILRFVKKSRIRFKFILFLTIGIFVSAGFSLIFAFWVDSSHIILLKHYGGYIYNPDSGGYQVSYDNVEPKNVERVKSLETSIMGIGWPLKAFFMFVFSTPISLVVFVLDPLNLKFRKSTK